MFQELSEGLRVLLASIDSVAELEALLALHAAASRAWDGAALAAELRIEPRGAEALLAALAERGLLRVLDGDPRRYAYSPDTPALRAAVDELAVAYTERRVTVVEFVYSKPVEKIRVFADAFRIRKDESDG